jgi:hypothetical protein
VNSVNVIVSNKKKQMLESLNIEIIKELNGEFDVDEIIENFKNFFFQRMILDISALKDYTDIRTIQKLSLSLDMNKVILVLDETTNTVSPEFMSKLISIGIYNFTTNLEGVMYLYNSPNSYRDVAHLHIIEQPVVATAPVIENGKTVYVEVPTNTNRIIGIKNVTKQSGATSLIYMMKKMLKKYYSVVAIEVEKSDFKFFNDKELISATNSTIGDVISKNRDKNVILIDVNNSENAMGACEEIIYLIEPSIFKLNRLMIINPRAFSNLKGKKVILNQSLLSSKDVSEFEFESGLKIYHNLPPINERDDKSQALIEFLQKLGFTKVN